jgi:hypothetical protein
MREVPQGEEMMKTEGRRWYLTAVAAPYLVICSAASVYYASLHFRTNAATVPWFTQFLCLGMAASAGLYFLKPRMGYKALLGLTILTILAIGTSDAKATASHLVVLLVLLMPFLFRKGAQKTGANQGIQLMSLPPRG